METLKHYGGEIKALGDGRIAGWAVRFTGPGDTDLEGDFFTADTRFGKAKEVDLYYDHGFDQTLKRRPVGDATLEAKDAGLWLEGQLSLRDEYERAIYELVESGKAAFSSGAVGHLVERENTGKGNWIKSWPIGEVSITMTPAEPRATAQAAKSAQIGETEAPDEADQPEAPEAKGAAPARTEVEPDSETITTPSKSTTMEQENNSTGAPQFDAQDALKRLEQLEASQKAFSESATDTQVKATNIQTPATAPVIIKSRGDNEANALTAFYAKGDTSGVKHMLVGDNEIEVKASNDTSMNITTNADGGFGVPTGHFGNIIARRDESAAHARLGVMSIPGQGTTVNVPYDNGAANAFVTTAEAAAFDRDAPVLAQKAFTLVKKSKQVQLSYELMQDEASRTLPFVENYVGRALAATYNAALVAEVIAAGTILKTTASSTALAVDELEDVVFGNTIMNYLDGGRPGWLMQPATHGVITKLDDANIRRYADNQQGGGRSLFGYPIVYSEAVDAHGTANNDFALFGDWSSVGLYEAPSLTVLRDQYSSASTGMVNFWYYVRFDFGVVQPEGIGFVRHPAT